MAYPTSFRFQELDLFDNVDGQVYARLVVDLGFDHKSAMRTVAFWNWLESCTGHVTNAVSKALPLSHLMLRSLAKEANWCINFLRTGMPPLPYYSDDFQLLFTPSFLGCGFSLRFLGDNMEIGRTALAKIDQFVEQVFMKKALSDVLSLMTFGVVYEAKLPSVLAYDHQMWARFRSHLCGCNTPSLHRRLTPGKIVSPNKN